MSEQKRIDLGKMISGPFKACLQCGQNEYGVWGIHRDRVLRRCRVCGHRQFVPLPPVQKKIIYLDQFVISEFAKLKNPNSRGHKAVAANPFWQELYDLLVELRELQLICCPDSWSHQQESRISGMNADLKQMYEQFSGGITFKNFPDIEAQQSFELAHAWAEQREPAFDYSPRNVLSADPNEWNNRFFITFGDSPFVDESEIQSNRLAVHQAIAEIFRGKWAVEKQSFEYWYEQERSEHQMLLAKKAKQAGAEREEAVAAMVAGASHSLDLLEKMLASPEENLFQGIATIFSRSPTGGMRSREDANELMRSFVFATRMNDAPYNKLESLMWAVIAMRAGGGQKDPPNEGMATDIKTVSRLLPYCDAMFVDNECRSLLANTPGRFKPALAERVYSMQTKEQFLAYLRGLKQNLSEEHIAGLREAYGDQVLANVPPRGSAQEN
jgi:hypothetical protein